MKKVLGDGKKQLRPKKRLQVMRAAPRRSAGGRARCRNSMEILEGGQSPLQHCPLPPFQWKKKRQNVFAFLPHTTV